MKLLALLPQSSCESAKFFQGVVSGIGYQSKVALSGRQALSGLSETAPGLAILDLQLPDISGKTLLCTVSTNPPLQDVWVIVATGEGRQSEALGPLADEVLLKPLDIFELHMLAARFWPGRTSAAP